MIHNILTKCTYISVFLITAPLTAMWNLIPNPIANTVEGACTSVGKLSSQLRKDMQQIVPVVAASAQHNASQFMQAGVWPGLAETTHALGTEGNRLLSGFNNILGCNIDSLGANLSNNIQTVDIALQANLNQVNLLLQNNLQELQVLTQGAAQTIGNESRRSIQFLAKTCFNFLGCGSLAVIGVGLCYKHLMNHTDKNSTVFASLGAGTALFSMLLGRLLYNRDLAAEQAHAQTQNDQNTTANTERARLLNQRQAELAQVRARLQECINAESNRRTTAQHRHETQTLIDKISQTGRTFIHTQPELDSGIKLACTTAEAYCNTAKNSISDLAKTHKTLTEAQRQSTISSVEIQFAIAQKTLSDALIEFSITHEQQRRIAGERREFALACAQNEIGRQTAGDNEIISARANNRRTLRIAHEVAQPIGLTRSPAQIEQEEATEQCDAQAAQQDALEADQMEQRRSHALNASNLIIEEEYAKRMRTLDEIRRHAEETVEQKRAHIQRLIKMLQELLTNFTDLNIKLTTASAPAPSVPKNSSAPQSSSSPAAQASSSATASSSASTSDAASTSGTRQEEAPKASRATDSFDAEQLRLIAEADDNSEIETIDESDLSPEILGQNLVVCPSQ